MDTKDKLLEIYHCLLVHYGPQRWWPADSPFEVIVGAILTQAAAWGNVEKAIANLKRAEALSPAALRHIPTDDLARLIHPCGYYNSKAQKLKAFVQVLGEEYGDDLAALFSLDVSQLREKLLSIYGIGEETADSIILYAAGKPIFVIDAYTRHILRRLGLGPGGESYAAFQKLFMDNLPHQTYLFNEYHALLVRHGKEVCKKKPLCPCCLSSLCSVQFQSG
jgi:endonuclease-3 related protein